MMGHMLLGVLSGTVILFGLAYIVFVLANKEKKGLKTTGQVLAWLIIILAVVFLIGGIYTGVYGKGCPMMNMGKKMPLKATFVHHKMMLKK